MRSKTVVNKEAVQNIMTRTSIRDYTNDSVGDDIVETILRAAMAAPSAGNKRPWAFIVVRNVSLLHSIAAQVRPHEPVGGASVAIVVCADTSDAKTFEGEGKMFWVQDCSAATQNILLAAHAQRLGAVWCGVYPLEERCNLLRDLLDIPQNVVPFSIVAIGYPREDKKPQDKWDSSLVRQNKWY
ncbi:MAG: nitroreductase family protein [Marinilabiliaceae bacterium]|nr:nitroreductase family protein [Marinilabiliaceae bacterium]